MGEGGGITVADKRPYAKIDVSYHWNQKWFQVERCMRNAMPNALPIALRNAVRVARDAHHASILYSRANATDGMFPVQAVKMMCAIMSDEEDAALTALFETGMWVNHPGGMAEVRDYLEHQTDSDTTKNRSEAARKAAQARWAKHAERNAERNAKRNADSNANRNAEERRGEKRREEVNKPDESRFDEFYAAYPRKMKPADARKAWDQVTKTTDPQIIIDGAHRLANDPNLPTDRKFIPYPASWLRADGWENEPYPPRHGDPPSQRSQVDDRVQAWMDLANDQYADPNPPELKVIGQ